MMNRNAILERPGSIVIEESAVPAPGAGEVLIKVENVGICGSDIHAFESGPFIRPKNPSTKIGLGHECSGTIAAIGGSCGGLSIGDRVAIEPGVPCGKCRYCREGRYNICPDVDFLATSPNYRGALTDYLVHPASMTYKLPDEVGFIEGAMVEPAAVGMHAALLAKVRPGLKIAILGSGCIGLMTLQACRALGATDVAVVDVLQKRLDLAKKLGAKYVVNAKETDVGETVKAAFGDSGMDVVFETAGSSATASLAVSIVGRGGKILIVGTIAGDTPINFLKINREVSIQTVFRYANEYPATIAAIASGAFDVRSMVTAIYDFEEVQRAFRESVDKKSEMIKSVVRMHGAV
jgi:L-iditol 2-dehydrogenase